MYTYVGWVWGLAQGVRKRRRELLTWSRIQGRSFEDCCVSGSFYGSGRGMGASLILARGLGLHIRYQEALGMFCLIMYASPVDSSGLRASLAVDMAQGSWHPYAQTKAKGWAGGGHGLCGDHGDSVGQGSSRGH